jgi:uncharacterized membrane protein YjjP (DUF1212 family)
MPKPVEQPGVAPEQAAHIAARIGRLLLSNGADTRHTLQRVADTARSLGYEAHSLVTVEAILVTVGSEAHFSTKVGHEIPAMAVHMGRLVALEHTVDEVQSGALAADAVDAHLDAVEAGEKGHPGYAVVLGVALTAGSLARLFGAEWGVVAASVLAGLVSTILRRGLGRHGVNAIASTFIIAFLSAIVGALVIRALPGASPVLCLTAAGMILVPGVPLINGVRDLVDGHAGNGMVRLAVGAVTVVAIGFGLFLAAAIAGDTLPVGGAPGSLPVSEDLLFSALAALGFSMLFNVPLRAVWVCIVCGMASHGLRTALEQVGLDVAVGSLIGAAAAGLIARFAAQHYRVPPVTFAFPGIVAMIPGSYGFRATIGALHIMAQGASASATLIAETLSLAITTIVVTAAIAIGLSLALSVGDRLRHKT